MIIDLPKTSTAAVTRKLVQLRSEVGAMTLGRVLTLLVVVDDESADDAIEVANEASRQHPCRIVVLVSGNRRGAGRMDGQIRVGGDAGASEVVVLRLYGALANHAQSVATPLLLADSPVVAWWPRQAPQDLRTDSIALMAGRRVTDASESSRPRAMLTRLATTYQPGDTDLSWTRVTLWRGLLAAALDGPPYEPVTASVVAGAPDSPSTDLLAAWLAYALKAPVTRVRTPHGSGIRSVRLERPGGAIDLVRPGDLVATMTQPGQPDRRISLRRRGDAECLADELRRLDSDDTYGDVLHKGLELLRGGRVAAHEAERSGRTPSVSEARRRAERLRRNRAAQLAASMIVAPPPPDHDDEAAVRKATARKLAARPTVREKQVGDRQTRKALERAVDQSASQAAADGKPDPASSAAAGVSPDGAASS